MGDMRYAGPDEHLLSQKRQKSTLNLRDGRGDDDKDCTGVRRNRCSRLQRQNALARELSSQMARHRHQMNNGRKPAACTVPLVGCGLETR
jgi:hypothetical protein